MALNTNTAPRSYAGQTSLAPLYVGALVLVFLGERVFGSNDAAQTALTGMGVAGAVAITVMRFLRAQRLEGERRWAERMMAVLSAVGLVALAIYGLTTDAGKNLTGIAKAAPDKRALIEGVATASFVSLLVIALVPMLFGELSLAPMRNAKVIEARRVRWAVSSGFSLACAVIYSALFVYAAGALEYKVDFSYFRTARPSESTRKIAESASEPITVRGFFPQLNEVGTEAEGYLRELAQAAPNVKFEMHDRLLVPAIAKEAKVTQDGVLVLTRGGSRETLTLGAEMKTAASKLKSLDGDFQKALLKVMREAKTAYLTVGHGELNEAKGGEAPEGRTGKGIRKLLESQNFNVKDLGLAQGLGTDVPADATLVIVLGPEKALLPEEISSLRRFADKGGHVLLALDPESKADHAPLAGAFGLSWSPTVLANDKVFLRQRHNNTDRALLVTNRFSSHASVSTLSRNSARAPVAFLRASSLDKKDGGDLKIDFAVKSMGDTFADDNGDFEFTQGSEKRQAYNLAAAITKSVPPPEGYKGKDPPELRAFVIADADALSDFAFGNEPNVYFAVDVIRWLGGEESFSGAIATTEDVRIEHTKQKDVLWFWGMIAGAPALVLGVGLVMNRKRRREDAPKAAKPAGDSEEKKA